MKKFFFLLVLIIFQVSLSAQEIKQDSVQDNECFLLNKKFIASGAVASFYLATFVDSYHTWWKDDKRPFTFMTSDWIENYGDRGMNKLGHFYTSYLFYKMQKDAFLWGGYTKSTSQILSGGLTFLMSLLIEVGDGFSRYGFDYKDFVFNSAGLSYSFLQDEFPFLDNFNFKFSYFPTRGYSFPPKFSDHYEGHIYWLTVNTCGIINHFSENNLPEYVQPAFGYSVSPDLRSEYLLAFDFNFLPFFKSDNILMKFISDFINLIHIPAPGVKFSEGKKPEYRLFLLN